MTVAIKLTIEDVKTMVQDLPKDIVLEDYDWLFAKQIDVKASFEFPVVGWRVLGYPKEK